MQAVLDDADTQALAEIKELHETSPKYVYDEESDDDVIRRCAVEVLALPATYARVSETKRVQVIDGNDRISVEEYAIRHFARNGWQALVLESRPLHALFGTMMWNLIQDESDDQLRTMATGNVRDFEAKRKGERIWFRHPQDFGSADYGTRRSAAIDRYLSIGMGDRDALLRLFDEGAASSWSLRNYLWAHLDEDMRAARRLIEILPSATVVAILRYLAADYWHHYLGWPDLLLWKTGEYLLVEVKSSKDKLSEDQKRWISDNFVLLRLPFRIVKVHKTAVAD